MSPGPPPRDLTDRALTDILAANAFGTLATVRRSGHPHLTTMLYGWDPAERIVRFFTTQDRVKVRQVRRDARAALHVPGPDQWSFAVAEGLAEVSEPTVTPGDEVGREIWSMLPDTMRPADEQDFLRTLVAERRVIIRLRVERLYGTALDVG